MSTSPAPSRSRRSRFDKLPVTEIHVNLVGLLRSAAAEQLVIVHHSRVRGKHILPTVIIQVEDTGAPTAERQRQHGQPARICHIPKQPAAEISMHRKRL